MIQTGQTPLLSCPFCGGAPLLIQNQMAHEIFRYACINCDAGPGGVIGVNEATDRWNRRGPDPDGNEMLDKDRRIAELEDELEEARDELANPVWPKWARSITEQLEKYGVEVDPFEGWDLPVDLEDWLSEAVRIETEKLKVLVKSEGWKITYDDGRTEYAALNPGLGESGNGLIVSVEKF